MPVVRVSQPYSVVEHMLVSAWGSKWKDVFLGVFTVYIDDSGTAPSQQVAMASGLIFPAKRILAMESEWATFCKKEGIGAKGFHTSECVAHNAHSDFARWDDDKVERVVERILQIIKKYSPQAFSISINKAFYDEVIPDEFRRRVGRKHYTWGVDAVCGFIWDWAHRRDVPMEYVFDNVDEKAQREQRAEIELVMNNGEEMHPGDFSGRYSFRNRRQVPALQCADLFAWTCYQRSLQAFTGKPLHPIAEKCWNEFGSWGDDKWCGAWVATKKSLVEWVARVRADPKEMARIRILEETP